MDVGPPYETAPVLELMLRFSYPLIVSGTTSNLFTTTGDINDYFYRLREEKFPSKKLFSTCWEFGTFGDSLPAVIPIGHAILLENCLVHFGASSEAVRN